MKDIKGKSIKDFARERGFAALTCYDTLKDVVKNDWVKITTHPKMQDNNTKIWYSVMMYNFLSKTNHDLNWLLPSVTAANAWRVDFCVTSIARW